MGIDDSERNKQLRDLQLAQAFAHPDDVRDYSDHTLGAPGPALEDGWFKIDIDSYTSPWNKQLAAIFAQDFVDNYEPTADFCAVEKAFITFIRSLRTKQLGKDKNARSSGREVQPNAVAMDSEARRRSRRKNVRSSSDFLRVRW